MGKRPENVYFPSGFVANIHAWTAPCALTNTQSAKRVFFVSLVVGSGAFSSFERSARRLFRSEERSKKREKTERRSEYIPKANFSYVGLVRTRLSVAKQRAVFCLTCCVLRSAVHLGKVLRGLFSEGVTGRGPPSQSLGWCCKASPPEGQRHAVSTNLSTLFKVV